MFAVTQCEYRQMVPFVREVAIANAISPVADPVFPVVGGGGGVDLVEGGTDSRGSYISKNLYVKNVKTKESGPSGGGEVCAPGTPH